MTRPHAIDPRGPRFGAALTTVVLAVAIATKSAWVLGAQAAVFALGAAGVSPYQWLFKVFVRPRLGPPAEREPAAPTRFAQVVGLVFAVAGTVGFATGTAAVGFVFTGFALAAAFLNAAFALCLGCELYLLLARAAGRPLSRRLPVS
ncbi:MAG: hypothetical protein QOF57_1790 [Frankiaceae bacterium]|jgi:hypothetical protein|nr:hypothetical protein [Frankiaceae bacterium]